MWKPIWISSLLDANERGGVDMANQLSSSQAQTQDTFSFKWAKRETYESQAMRQTLRQWLLEKYFDGDEARLTELLDVPPGPKRILDAGCGSSGSALVLFGDRLNHHQYVGVDISDAVNVAREKFAEQGIAGE